MLLALTLPVVASAQPRTLPTEAPRGTPGNPSTSKPQDDPPMRFELVREGPADACGKSCRTWIAAAGRITPDTARDFQAFARSRDLRGMVVVLESNGGTVTAGLDLGRQFRRLEMTTTVGKTTMLGGEGDEKRATLSPRAVCASMCAFALIGGARRHVPAESRVLVHQIWPSAKREDAAAQAYSAENLVSLQRSLGQMARYTIEMGIEIELFEVAMRIPPWERMRALSQDELKRMRVRTIDNAFEPGLTASGPVVPLPPLPNQSQVTAPVASGWTYTERDGLRGLTRRHPLTIEGDDIGSFEIMFACGTTSDAYALQYTEKRRQPDARERLAKVLVLSGKDRVPLTIESSATSEAGLDSVARGAFPSALLQTYAEKGDHSIVVATETSTNVRTLIRVGNTGLTGALPQLAAVCKR